MSASLGIGRRAPRAGRTLAAVAVAAVALWSLPRLWRHAAVWGSAGVRPAPVPAPWQGPPLQTGLGPLRAQARVVQPFGWMERAGLPWFAADVRLAVADAAPVDAVAAGRVEGIGDDPLRYGLYVLVRHDLGWASLYGDCTRVVVARGALVGAGQVVCFAGDSGPPGPGHLIFGLLYDGAAVNPQPYLLPPAGGSAAGRGAGGA